MVVGNAVEEKLALPAKEITIHSGRGTAGKRPRRVAVVRQRGVCVLQVGDRDEPVAYPQPGHAVELHHGSESVLHARALEKADHENDAKVREEDFVPLALLEQDRVR